MLFEIGLLYVTNTIFRVDSQSHGLEGYRRKAFDLPLEPFDLNYWLDIFKSCHIHLVHFKAMEWKNSFSQPVVLERYQNPPWTGMPLNSSMYRWRQAKPFCLVNMFLDPPVISSAAGSSTVPMSKPLRFRWVFSILNYGKPVNLQENRLISFESVRTNTYSLFFVRDTPTKRANSWRILGVIDLMKLTRNIGLVFINRDRNSSYIAVPNYETTTGLQLTPAYSSSYQISLKMFQRVWDLLRRTPKWNRWCIIFPDGKDARGVHNLSRLAWTKTDAFENIDSSIFAELLHHINVSSYYNHHEDCDHKANIDLSFHEVHEPSQVFEYVSVFRHSLTDSPRNDRGMGPNYIPMEFHAFQFITCYRRKSKILFWLQDIIMPFDKWTWASLATIGLLIVGAFMGENVHIGSSVLWVFAVLLEQSYDIRSSYGNTMRLSEIRVGFVAGTWLLITIVLTSGYKGIVITKITSPHWSEQFQTFSDLLSSGVNIYSEPSTVRADQYNIHEQVPGNDALNFDPNYVPSRNETQLYAYTSWKIRGIRAIKDGEEILQSYAKKMYRISNISEHFQVPNSTLDRHVALQLRDCDVPLAYADWNDRLESKKQALERVLSKTSKVIFGKEELIHMSVGWEVWNYMDPTLPRKVQGIIHSGIYNFWKRRRKYSDFLISNSHCRSQIIDAYNSTSLDCDTNEDELAPTSLQGGLGYLFIVTGACQLFTVSICLLEMVLNCLLN
jgi:hypothetical protein